MFFRSLLICSAIISSSAIAHEQSFYPKKSSSEKKHHSSHKRPHRHGSKPHAAEPAPTTIIISPKVAFGKVSINVSDSEKVNFPKDTSQYPWAPFLTNGSFDPLSKNIDFDESTGSLIVKEGGIYSVEYAIKAVGRERFITYVNGPIRVAIQVQSQEKLLSKSNNIELLRLFNSVESHSLVASGSRQMFLSLTPGDRVSLIVQEIPTYTARTKEEKERDELLELPITDKPMSLYFAGDDDSNNTTYLLLRKID